MKMEAIKAVNIVQQYKEVRALDALSLSVEEGELFSLLGVNGAGKSTLVKILSCLLSPTSGEGYILGRSVISESDEVKKNIAVSPQESAVAPMLTVRENLELIAGVHGFSKEKRAEKISELCELLSLSEVIDRRSGKLSGGYQRRLSVAMALVSEPKVLFLDEPTLGMDVLARAELWEVIRALRGRVTVVLTTHYMEEAEALSDRIGIMNKGRLITVDTPDNIKASVGAGSVEEAFIKIVKGAEK